MDIFLNYILHIDTHLFTFVSTYGFLTYILIFTIIFCETGLVVFPFLPGDSLLFAAGGIAASAPDALNIQLLFTLLVLASILGNKVNYLIGKYIGPRVFYMENHWLLNKKYLKQAHQFYNEHGGKAIIFARFIPIIRTFAPFIAGAANMSLRSFTFYNLLSGFFWIGSLLGAGYFFGSLPLVKQNFSLIIYGIILLSLLPPIFAFLRQKWVSA